MNARTKVLRHQDKRYDIDALYRAGDLEAYQSVQGQDLLNCEYVIAFIGKEGTKAVFAGIWKVIRKLEDPYHTYVADFPFPELFENHGDSYYQFEKLPGYSDLEARLVIDWGPATRAWHQWLKDKPILEILAKGKIDPFPGYLDFVLSFDELKDLVMHPDANRVWHQMLSAVAGIYLIIDNETGDQYVGSASGKDGFLGRWRSYAQNGHGGNKSLIQLLHSYPGRAEAFSFTILQTLPNTLTTKEVIAKEQLYKHKLGSRAHGLNLN